MAYERREGWESRLSKVIEAARTEHYELGRHDCFRLACQAIEALTGVDRWSEYAGRYHTRREELRLLAEHGSTFEGAFDRVFGAVRVDLKQARRGDIVSLMTVDGKKHLGVCIGSRAAFLAETGLLFVPLSSCFCAWLIG